jgi:hypothetical protein
VGREQAEADLARRRPRASRSPHPAPLCASYLLVLASLGIACSGSFGPVEKDRPPLGASGAGAISGAAGTESGVAGNEAMSGSGGAPSDAGGAGSGGDTGGSAGAGASAAGTAGSEPPVPAVICDAITKVFQTSCGGGSCHTNPNAYMGNWGIGLAEARQYVDRPSIRDASCGKIIDSSDYSKSLILVKLEGPIPPLCGGPMPVGSYGDFSREQIYCVASWLQQFQK